ncbi:hypothetical protein ACE1ET_03345 [Saccharicrinis sp. FJH62]|uniref:hypothetical protein n=1 Tax=Saccharicrinis sp. FJH62 TaxID=3344657 RepID=UPI0035D41E2C
MMRRLPSFSLLIAIFLTLDAYCQILEVNFNSVPDIIASTDSSQKIFICTTEEDDMASLDPETGNFSDSVVVNYYNNHFINKIVYKDSAYANDTYIAELMEKTKVFPGYYFLDNLGYVIFKDYGIKSSDELLKMGEAANQRISIVSQVNAKKRDYESRKKDKIFLTELIEQENEIGQKDSVALYDLLSLTGTDDYLDIEIIKAILNNEESIYGSGYRFISEADNRLMAAIICCREKNMSMDEIMYEKTLEIIRINMEMALNERDEQLFNDCKNELKRVMSDKEKAEKICNKAHKKFYR